MDAAYALLTGFGPILILGIVVELPKDQGQGGGN